MYYNVLNLVYFIKQKNNGENAFILSIINYVCLWCILLLQKLVI